MEVKLGEQDEPREGGDTVTVSAPVHHEATVETEPGTTDATVKQTKTETTETQRPARK